MMIYIANPTESVMKLLEPKRKCTRVTGYKANAHTHKN